MIESKKRLSLVAIGLFVLSGAVAGQDLPMTSISAPAPQPPSAFGARLKTQVMPAYEGRTTDNPQKMSEGYAVTLSVASSQAANTPGEVRRITLDQAQQLAAGASSPLARLGELQVEAAKQHRLGVQSMYFPNLGSQFEDLHFNKKTAKVLAVQGPLGNLREFGRDIFAKDSNSVNISAVQPITPLMAIHQLVKIARADENIARAKAGLPVAETASKVEKNYFDLLVAEKELVSAEAEAKKIQGKWLTASSSGVGGISAEQERDMVDAEKLVLAPTSKVKELTASLNEMLGLPEGTRLELVPPEPLVENISLTEVTDKALAANPEVVEAEQTALKAHAAAKISKMEYGPSVAVIGGYMNQNLVDYFFPRGTSYIGVVATYTVFDFGKREHGVQESKVNAEAADLGVQLTKAKVAAAVKSSYFELQRSRQYTQLARRMMSATRVVEASYQPDNAEVESARAKVEADMYRAELEYRQAYGRLKSLMGRE